MDDEREFMWSMQNGIETIKGVADSLEDARDDALAICQSHSIGPHVTLAITQPDGRTLNYVLHMSWRVVTAGQAV